MLDALNDQPIGSYRLQVEKLGQTRFFDQQNFELYLIDSHANKSRSPIFRGLYNAGRPSIHVPTWIDGEFVEGENTAGPSVNALHPPSSVESKSPILTMTLAELLAQKLGALIPRGGRFWLAYESFEVEGELMRETRAGLLANIPLVTTPIGFLLFRAECWLGLRDWHFPEGGREGPRKLQGNKAVNSEHAKQRAAEMIEELRIFQTQRAENKVIASAHSRAEIVLSSLKEIAGKTNTK